MSVRLVREGLEEHEPAAISSPADVYSLMSGLKGSDRERMYSLHLDTKNRVLNCEEISCGTLFSPQIHPREVFKSAILTSSASIILVHNHPRDDPQPSPEDAAIPKKLSECGDILGIDRLDRIIIGEGSYYSFKEAGEMERYKGKN